MKISIIVAMAKNNVIGVNNSLPWKLPADLKRFKDITMGNPIIMGRNTHESIGRVLPGRTNIILTSKPFEKDGCVCVSSIDEALKKCDSSMEVFIIGGEKVFRSCLTIVDKMYITMINDDIPGDTFFPEINMNDWKKTEEEAFKPDEKNKYEYSFIVLEKNIDNTILVKGE